MKITILLSLIVLPFFLFSQIQWQEKGVPVYCGENINWTETTIKSADGNMVMVWWDSRNGDQGIFAQKIALDGTLLWGETGREINDDPDTQYHPATIANLNNEIIIAWVSHFGNFDMEIRVQKIDGNGLNLWQDEGALIYADNDLFPYRIQIIDDLNGGAFVVWKNYSLEPDPIIVKGLHVLADGSIDNNWNAAGNILIPNLHNYYLYILPDGYGGFIYAYKNLDDLHIQRIDSNGDPLWGDEGIILCEDTVCNNRLVVTSDYEGLFYFFWADSRNVNSNAIYMQKVDINGNSMFADDINVYDGNYSDAKVAYTSNGNLALSWTGSINNQVYLKTLKLDTTGNVLITPTDVYIGSELCGDIDTVADNNGGYWVEWFNIYGIEGLFLQHIDNSGEITLEENGLLVCTTNQYDYCSFTLNLTWDNRAFLCWLDKSTRSNILYSQIVDETGNLHFPDDGLLIHEGPAGYISDLQIIISGDNPIFGWIEENENDKSIFVQSLNSDGTAAFEENGIPILISTSPSFDEYEIYTDNDNQIIITTEHANNMNSTAKAQVFDNDGNLLWGENGIYLSNIEFEQYNVKISSKDGLYYSGWSEYNGDFSDPIVRIIGQKIDDSGNLLWGNEGVLITDRAGDDMLTDIEGQYYIWQNEHWPVYEIYAKLVDENGDTAPGWDENGTLICGAEGTQSNARGIIIPDGLLIIWEDERDVVDNSLDIYAQLITEDGDILWQEDGIPLVDHPEDQSSFEYIFDEYLYLVWQDFRSDDFYEVYAQKYDLDGNELWTDGGVLIGAGENPDIAKIGDRLLIVLQNSNESYFDDIYLQLLNLEGELLWNPAGLVLCDASWKQYNPQIVTNSSNYIFIGWLDERVINSDPYCGFATSVFAQKVYLGPSYSPEDILNAFTGKLNQNYPNPFNPSTTISFNLPEDQIENAELKIYNLKGQKVKNLSVSLNSVQQSIEGYGKINSITSRPSTELRMTQAGSNTYSVVWNGTDDSGKHVSSGIYLYKLKSGNFEKTRKMLLMK